LPVARNRHRVFNRNFTPAITKELFVVIDTDGFTVARSPSEMTKAQTIRDILVGAFTVGSVLCLCPDEGSCRDVSEDMANEVLAASYGPLDRDARDFAERQLGFRAIADFEREVEAESRGSRRLLRGAVL
jgi:hypothetical protein